MAIPSGTRLGRFEISSLIGTGGMGEVYLAKDTRLSRPVALKVLLSEFTHDEDLLKRFTQEALALSALNHPNIISIYEADCQESTHFIVMEFIEGITVRQRMVSSPLKIIEALDISIQVASALGAAHEAGITHRDIKPSNIMLRHDDYVKVLDFGLAKLIKQVSEREVDDPTRPMIHTESGAVMGTVNYMSPEQVRGLKIDARTDIWSLGCVLYEMITGHRAFEGKTPNDVIAQILEHEPPPLARYTREANEALEWIVMKAMTGNVDERYQTAKEMLADLKKLHRRLEIEAENRRAPVQAVTLAQPVTASSEYQAPVAAAISPEIGATATAVKSAPSLPIMRGIQRHSQLLLLGLATLVIVIGAIAFNWQHLFPPQTTSKQDTKQDTKPTPINVQRVGLESRATTASISPDGNFIVYVAPARGSEGICLWIRQISQGTSVPITKPIKEAFIGDTYFSPKGDIVYYLVYPQANNRGILYQVPAIGGQEPKEILRDIDSSISLSPDGKQFAFFRWSSQSNESALMIANTDRNGQPESLRTRRGKDRFVPALAWSPDKEKIACAVNTSTDGNSTTIVEINIKDKTEQPLTSHKWDGGIGKILWLKGASGLIINAKENDASSMQLWRVSYPLGEAQRIANSLTEFSPDTLAATDDSSTLIVEVLESTSAIWVAPLNSDERQVRILPTDKYDGCGGMSWTPDHRIVYGAKRGDNYDIWIMKEDGSESTYLTSDAYTDVQPRVSPNGRYIVFVSDREGNTRKIWRMNLDGGNPTRLSPDEGVSPTCSPDGKWVVYVSPQDDGKPSLWRVPLEGGGEPQKISDKTLEFPHFSPKDENRIVCIYYDQNVNSQGQPALLSLDKNTITPIDLPKNAVSPPNWMPDGQSVFYVESNNGYNNIWSQNIASNKRVQLTNFSKVTIGCFNVSKSEKLVLSAGSTTSSIYLLKN